MRKVLGLLFVLALFSSVAIAVAGLNQTQLKKHVAGDVVNVIDEGTGELVDRVTFLRGLDAEKDGKEFYTPVCKPYEIWDGELNKTVLPCRQTYVLEPNKADWTNSHFFEFINEQGAGLLEVEYYVGFNDTRVVRRPLKSCSVSSVWNTSLSDFSDVESCFTYFEEKPEWFYEWLPLDFENFKPKKNSVYTVQARGLLADSSTVDVVLHKDGVAFNEFAAWTAYDLEQWWSHNESTGTTVNNTLVPDTTFNVTNFTLYNTPTWNCTSLPTLAINPTNCSVQYDPTSLEYAITSNAGSVLEDSVAGTWQAWVYKDNYGAGGSYEYFWWWNGGLGSIYHGLWEQETNSSNLQWVFTMDAGAQIGWKLGAPPLTLDVWNHIAVTWNASRNNVTMYVNGTQTDTVGTAFTKIDSGVAFVSLEVGRQLDGTYFSGKQTDVRVWGRELSGAQILSLYQTGAAGAPVTLTPDYVTPTPANQTYLNQTYFYVNVSYTPADPNENCTLHINGTTTNMTRIYSAAITSCEYNVTTPVVGTNQFFVNVTAPTISNTTSNRTLELPYYLVRGFSQADGAALGVNMSISNGTIISVSDSNATNWFHTQVPYGAGTIITGNASGYLDDARTVTVTQNTFGSTDLYLLPSGSSTLYVRFHVQNAFNAPTIGANVNLTRNVGGTQVTIANGSTDASGVYALYLEQGAAYTVYVTSGTFSSTSVLTMTANDYYFSFGTATAGTCCNSSTYNITWKFTPASLFILTSSHIEFNVSGIGTTNVTYAGLNVSYPNGTLISSNTSNTTGTYGFYYNVTNASLTNSLYFYGFFQQDNFSLMFVNLTYQYNTTLFNNTNTSAVNPLTAMADDASSPTLAIISILVTLLVAGWVASRNSSAAFPAAVAILALFCIVNWFNWSFWLAASVAGLSVWYIRRVG